MKMKKAFACLLAVLLICGIMPTGVFADETSDGEPQTNRVTKWLFS